MSFLLPNAEAYIFDFNGTLFWDSEENRKAWSDTFLKFRGKEISDEEYRMLNGRTDEETVLYLAPEKTEEEREAIAIYKEKLYHDICLKQRMTLSPGAETLLTYLKNAGIPIAIASSAPKMNMDWYIPEYGLNRFFPEKLIIAGRTDIPSKPDSAIFRLAIKKLDAKAENTIIFEDSASGVKAALDAGVKLVIRIKDPGLPSIRDPRVMEIASFEEITTEIQDNQ